MWGQSGVEALLTRPQLLAELQSLERRRGVLLYSRDSLNQVADGPADELFNQFRKFNISTRAVERPHRRVAKGWPDGATTLMIAAVQGWTEIVDDLAHRTSIDATEDHGYTALMMAANQGQPESVKILLAGGASPHAQANDGSTPLMFAAQCGDLDAVRHLVDAGADAGARGRHGLTARDFAVQNGHRAIVEILS